MKVYKEEVNCGFGQTMKHVLQTGHNDEHFFPVCLSVACFYFPQYYSFFHSLSLDVSTSKNQCSEPDVEHFIQKELDNSIVLKSKCFTALLPLSLYSQNKLASNINPFLSFPVRRSSLTDGQFRVKKREFFL